MSQTPGSPTPSPADDAGGAPKVPDGGSWPPVPPSVVNRVVSSATAVPFTPIEEKPASNPPMFSCIVEPPPRKVRQPSGSGVRNVQPTAPAVSGPVAAPTPSGPAKETRAPMSLASNATIPPMTTVPPFGIGSSQSPFAPESATAAAQEVAPQKFDFKPERPAATRWLSWSTLLFVLVCAGGYWKYRQMQTESTPTPVSAMPVGANEAAKPATSGGIATPFTALKQAQATIKDAGAKHKAAYDLVEKMLDDPAKAGEVPAKPKAPAEVLVAPVASESPTPKSTRDFAAVQLGSDGEFVVPEGMPRPSVNFVRWIKAVKIGGVRLTERPRVLIGANAYTFGEVVDLNLGIVLDGYNAETRMLRFQEPSGAVIERRI